MIDYFKGVKNALQGATSIDINQMKESIDNKQSTINNRKGVSYALDL